jgi:hypothetical protein
MKHRRVVTTPEADADAQRIDEWWIQHRGAAPNLFVEELADAIAPRNGGWRRSAILTLRHSRPPAIPAPFDALSPLLRIH